jgi:hypothetical protein
LREQLQRGAAGRGTELFAFDVLHGLDRAIGLGDQHERRPVVDLIDHHRLLARLVGGLLDKGIDVAEAGVVGARHDPGNRDGGAFALVERDVEAFGLEVPLLLRHVVPGVDALQLEIEREFDRRRRLSGGRVGAGERQPQACEQACEQRGRAAKAGHGVVLGSGPLAAQLLSKLRAKACLVGLALSHIVPAMAALTSAIRSFAACCGSHCLDFGQRPIRAD